jgi:hypothetical protein
VAGRTGLVAGLRRIFLFCAVVAVGALRSDMAVFARNFKQIGMIVVEKCYLGFLVS